MKKWILRNKKADVSALSVQTGLSKALCSLLVNRGHDTYEKITAFMTPEMGMMHSPMLMKDLESGCEIIFGHIKENKKIRIVGDYDVDGIISSYSFMIGLTRCGGRVDYDIPDRVADGYGINKRIIDKAIEDGIQLIITCDNGISAVDTVRYAAEHGLTVIITDHHELQEELPPAHGIIDPKNPECDYPFKGLCGAGVVYKCIEYLYGKFNIPEKELHDLLQYTAIATVCDIVDLIDENRVIVSKGLEILNKTENLGLRSLMEVNGITDKKIGSYDLGFIIGPCLNAAGRLENAHLALDMLLAQESQTAKDLALRLKMLNDERKEKTENGIVKVMEQIKEKYYQDKIKVIYEADLHESIAGIVAGRAKDVFNRPVIVFTDTIEGAKGSGRSIEGYDIFAELSKHRRLFRKFGGHPMAAGLSLENSSIDLLRNLLNEDFPLEEEDLLELVRLDLFLPIKFITEGFIDEIDRMEPFGKSNSRPVFGAKNVKVQGAKIVGKKGNVIQLKIKDEADNLLDGIIFNETEEFNSYILNKFGQKDMDNMYLGYSNSIFIDIAYYPSINSFRGNRKIQAVIKHYK